MSLLIVFYFLNQRIFLVSLFIETVDMSHDEGDVALASGSIALDQDRFDRVDEDASPTRNTSETQELAFLGSVGFLVESFAKNLDDFIGHALDEWGSPSGSKKTSRSKVIEQATIDTPDTKHHTDRTRNECSSVAWSWNESFSDEDNGWIGTRVMSPSTSPCETEGHPIFDLLRERKERVSHAMEKNPLNRYKKQNAWLKSKVLGLEKQIAAMEHEEKNKTEQDLPCSLHDEHVTLQMQIEQLLSQKSRLVYENDSLKRENARLNELIEYFFASSRQMNGEEDGNTSDACIRQDE